MERQALTSNFTSIESPRDRLQSSQTRAKPGRGPSSAPLRSYCVASDDGSRPADRRQGGHRAYGAADLRRLSFIRRCREFGVPIEQVRSLVGLIDDESRSCLEVRDLAGAHLAQVRVKLEELRALEASLTQMVEDCGSACAGGPGPRCVILEDLSSSPGCGGCAGKAKA